MKKTLKIALPIVAVLLIVCIMGGCFFTTQQNEYSIVRQFGKVEVPQSAFIEALRIGDK